MKTKIVQFVPIILSILLIAFSYFAGKCGVTETCAYYTNFGPYAMSVLEPSLLFTFCLLPIAIILMFVPRTIFQSWFRFAMWFVPLSVVLIAITPVTSNSWMPLFFISREEVSWYLGALFAVISLILIIWKYFSARRVQ